MQQLLIATHNLGKLREYRDLLADLSLDVVNLDEANIDFDVEETGTTFAENAILKARTYAEAAGLWTWADDSGLGGRCPRRSAGGLFGPLRRTRRQRRRSLS